MWAYEPRNQYETAEDEPEPTEYEQMVQQKREETMLRQQIRKHGEDELRGGGEKTDNGAVRSFTLKAPGANVAKKDAKTPPLRDLMKQMGLQPGAPIDSCCTKAGDAKVATIGDDWDKRGTAPLKNPQKRWALKPEQGAHGLCLPAGHCTAAVGSISSGKSTTLQSCLAQNHAQWRYDNVWLMHPDSDAALQGEYGLCTDTKCLPHFEQMDWWANESPGRTALVIDDVALNALSKRGADKSQQALADRTLGYLRSHKDHSMDIYIGTQHIYNLPPALRKYVSTWLLFPKRISPSTYGAIATATMLDKSTLKRLLSFVDTDYGFVLVNNLNDGRARVRVFDPHPRAVKGLL